MSWRTTTSLCGSIIMSGPFGSTAWMANPSTGGFYNFPISNSIRLSETGYFTHTNDSDSDSRTKFTYSTWVKLTSTSTAHHQEEAC